MKALQGVVISNKMAKTAVIEVKRTFRHPFYHKSLNRTKKYHVHDELNAQPGDQVRFIPCRPLSKTKRWKTVELVQVDPTTVSKRKQNKKSTS
jgi:small subunit ribosomal protein S17